jgi:hypothetical protein
VTDDEPAITLALAAAEAAGGGIVFFPVGTYKITTKITIPERVKLLGCGREITAADGTIINFTGAGFAVRTADGSAIENMTIKSADDGVELYGTFGAIIRDCLIIGANLAGSIGVQLSDGTLTNPTYYCSIYNTRIRKFKTLLKFNRYANANYVYGSQLINSAADGGADYAIYMDGGTSNYIHAGIDATIGTDAIYLTAGAGYTCHGNEFRGYYEVSGETNGISFNHNGVKDNKFYVSGSQLTYDDVAYSTTAAVRNTVIYCGTQGLPSSSFYDSTTENMIGNANLNYGPDATYSIMPSDWAVYTGAGQNWTIVDDATTLYGYKALNIAIGVGDASSSGISWSVSAGDLALMLGKVVTFGCWTKTATADRVRLTINDGVTAYTSGFNSGGNTWEYDEISILVDAAAASVKFAIADTVGMTNGQSYYFAIPTAIIGKTITETRPKAVLNDSQTIYRPMIHNIITLPDDATPSVKCGSVFLTGGTTTITDFDDGVTGQVITIIAEHSLDITDGTNIFLSGSATWSMTATDTLTLIQKADGKWYETARSDSGA